MVSNTMSLKGGWIGIERGVFIVATPVVSVPSSIASDSALLSSAIC